jgi:signal transduction histidine kinase
MKLKTQFRMLSLVSALTPLLATALLGFIARQADILTGPGRQLLLTRERLERAMTEGADETALGDIVRRAEKVDVILEDPRLVPIAWNFSEAERFAAGGYAGLASAPGGFIMARIGNQEKEYYLISVQMRPEGFRRGFIASRAPLALVFFAFLFLVPLITSLWLNRTLGVLHVLREATIRISSGDFDFRMIIEGPEEIADLSKSFDGMRRALKEEAERRARFLMAVSHDLKTPLAVVRGYVEALMDGHGVGSEQREAYLSIIERKTMMLESRIREMVNLISLSTNDWRITFRPVELKGYLTSLAADFKDMASVFGRQLTFRIDIDGRARALLDEHLFSRSLENILFNAIKYTGKDGDISMTCRPFGGGIELAFSDNGPGISEADRARAFEPFYRGAAAARIPGMGLGLSIVKSIMEAHGFSVTIGGGSKGGTVVAIRILTLPDKSPAETS